MMSCRSAILIGACLGGLIGILLTCATTYNTITPMQSYVLGGFALLFGVPGIAACILEGHQVSKKTDALVVRSEDTIARTLQFVEEYQKEKVS